MISNKNYKRICVIDYLPLNVRLDLEDNFRKQFFDKGIKKCGTRAMDLAIPLGFTKENINRWRRDKQKKGRTRPTLEAILKIANFLDLDIKSFWSKIVSFGKAGSKEFLALPYSIQFDEDLAWFFGFRGGDGIKTNLLVGGCASPKEIKLLLKYKNIFDSFIKTSNKWSIYIKSRNASKESIRNLFPECRIYQYIDPKKYNEGGAVNLCIGSKVLTRFFRNIDHNLEKILLNSPDEVKCAYLRGFFDTDGHVDIHGNLVLTQKEYFRIKRVENILESVKIKFKTFKRREIYYIIIYDLKGYKSKVNFESDIKRAQLNKISTFFNVLRDDSKIIDKIIKLTNNPITKKELMFELNTKYGKMSNAIHRLVKEGTLVILKQKPLTVVNSGVVDS